LIPNKAENGIKTHNIVFPNNNPAQIVKVHNKTSAESILTVLDIKRLKSLILVFGSAKELDDTIKPRLVHLLNRGLIPAAIEKEAIVIDGGTKAGIMELVGKGMIDLEKTPILLGVAPTGKVTYPGDSEVNINDKAQLDPNHSHFVLVESNEWGGETKKLYELAKALVKNIPVVTVLVGGGEISKNEVLMSVRQGWPIIVIENTGSLANQISTYKSQKKSLLRRIFGSHNKPAIQDEVISEIVKYSGLKLFPLTESPDDLMKVIAQSLTADLILESSWERFALYDQNAIHLQRSFNRIQLWILGLGILATILAVSQTQFQDLFLSNSISGILIKYTIIIMPITISILISAANRFRSGTRWVQLRAAAEAIKSEIYRYRTQVGFYGGRPKTERSPKSVLAQRIETINKQLMQTEVSLSGLGVYKGQIPPKMYGDTTAYDDGFEVISADRYVNLRLESQLNYYQLKTSKLEKRLRMLQWLTYIIGGIGTFLAAIEMQLWIAVTIAISTAITSFLEYRQVENTLIKYNQVATDLYNTKAWWSALSPAERSDPKNKNILVENTENILHIELAGWVKQMEDTLAKLYSKHEKYEKNETNE
jgi:hypothetical protein